MQAKHESVISKQERIPSLFEEELDIVLKLFNNDLKQENWEKASKPERKKDRKTEGKKRKEDRKKDRHASMGVWSSKESHRKQDIPNKVWSPH